ncbi:hypothetical protein NB713_003665 [Xanthomonas sacchari]|nr:hypothetical protein [Xanthomonas sacchari]
MAEGAGPGPGQAFGAQVAGLQQLQQREQLAAEERLAAAFAGQGQQRHQQRTLAGDAAVVALHAPHRDHRLRVDTVLLRHLREQVAMRGEHGATIVDALAVDQAGQVVPDRRGELGLCVEQRQHARIRLQAGGEAVEGRLGDARLRRGRAQTGHATGEGRIGRGRRRRGWGLRERARGRQQQDPGQTHHRNILADGRADIINNRRVCAPLTRRGRQARDRQRVPSVAWLADRAARCRGRDTHGVPAAAAFRRSARGPTLAPPTNGGVQACAPPARRATLSPARRGSTSAHPRARSGCARSCARRCRRRCDSAPGRRLRRCRRRSAARAAR